MKCHCGCWINEHDWTEVYNESGDSEYVCESCLKDSFTMCGVCKTYQPKDMVNIYGTCNDCVDSEDMDLARELYNRREK